MMQGDMGGTAGGTCLIAALLVAIASGCNGAKPVGDGATGCGKIPAAVECGLLCQDVCSRLKACGVAWSARCLDDCYAAYACPGETPGHDAAICSGALARVKPMACAALCAWTTSERPWGGECTFPDAGRDQRTEKR